MLICVCCSNSESSLFISPHRLILKTCGTTLNLLGVPRILEIAREHAGLPVVHRCFYSRKAFMFPERQLGPHRGWDEEVRFLDGLFSGGSAYTVGRVNGDHWLLYMFGPQDPSSPLAMRFEEPPEPPADHHAPPGGDASMVDHTIEILMTNLAPEARASFFTPDTVDEENAGEHGIELSSKLGIADIFPRDITTLDAYSFTPCGYSSNVLLKWLTPESAQDAPAPGASGEGYYTIHVTPEEGWSYASFECNVPLPAASNGLPGGIPDLQTLIRRVVDIFNPGRITVTLFVSSAENTDVEERSGETAVEAAQRAFRTALTKPLSTKKDQANDGVARPPPLSAGRRVYKRTDKINYEFGGYDLAFASFEAI